MELGAHAFVLRVVPSDADRQPEPAAAQDVELGGLLGHERRLALGKDQHACEELQVLGDGGEVREQREHLVELVLGRERRAREPSDRAVEPTRIGAEDVVERQQVIKARALDRSGERTDDRGIGADIDLRKDDAELHRE